MTSDYVVEYSKLYSEPLMDKVRLDGLVFKCITVENREWLERPFSENEIVDAPNSLVNDKTPSPDGFPNKFFKVF